MFCLAAVDTALPSAQPLSQRAYLAQAPGRREQYGGIVPLTDGSSVIVAYYDAEPVVHCPVHCNAAY